MFHDCEANAFEAFVNSTMVPIEFTSAPMLQLRSHPDAGLLHPQQAACLHCRVCLTIILQADDESWKPAGEQLLAEEQQQAERAAAKKAKKLRQKANRQKQAQLPVQLQQTQQTQQEQQAQPAQQEQQAQQELDVQQGQPTQLSKMPQKPAQHGGPAKRGFSRQASEAAHVSEAAHSVSPERLHQADTGPSGQDVAKAITCLPAQQAQQAFCSSESDRHLQGEGDSLQPGSAAHAIAEEAHTSDYEADIWLHSLLCCPITKVSI